jgi:hypothetical protein
VVRCFRSFDNIEFDQIVIDKFGFDKFEFDKIGLHGRMLTPLWNTFYFKIDSDNTVWIKEEFSRVGENKNKNLVKDNDFLPTKTKTKRTSWDNT